MTIQPNSGDTSRGTQETATTYETPVVITSEKRTQNSSSTNCNCQYVWRDIIWPLVPGIVGTGLAIGSCISSFRSGSTCSNTDKVAGIAMGVSALCLALISCIRISCFQDKDLDDVDQAFYNAHPGLQRPPPRPPTYNYQTGKYEYGGTPGCKPIIMASWFFMVPAGMGAILGIVMGAIPLPKYSCS